MDYLNKIRLAAPSIIASDIIGVQPLEDSLSDIFRGMRDCMDCQLEIKKLKLESRKLKVYR